ncbi:MAG: YcxB family protein [Clostridia bacterium]|nr:YcxB family protein [Clostridia bacterium]
MDALFEVKTVDSKKTVKKYSSLLMVSKAVTVLYYVLAGLLLLLWLIAAVLMPDEAYNLTYCLILGLILFVFALFMPEIVSSSSLKRTPKALLNTETTYRFYDGYFSQSNDVVKTNSKYCVFDRIVERRDCYALYMGRMSVAILPKDCFTQGLPGGSPENFRRFIEERVHVRAKTAGAGRTAPVWLKCVIAVLVLCLMLAAVPLSKKLSRETQEIFDYPDYSISLTSEFEDYTEYYDGMGNGYILAADGISVYVTPVTEGYVSEYYGEISNSPETYLEILESEYGMKEGLPDKKVEKADNGDITVSFSYTVVDGWDTQGETLTEYYEYYFAKLQYRDGVLWTTEIFCDSEYLEEYESLIPGWLDSVVIK